MKLTCQESRLYVNEVLTTTWSPQSSSDIDGDDDDYYARIFGRE